jgi:hypothetical protein
VNSMTRTFGILMVAACVALAATSSARATFILRVYEDGVHVGPDITGSAELTGTYTRGDFTFKIDATSNSPGDADNGQIQNITVVARNTAGASHTLTMVLSDVDFSMPAVDRLTLNNSVDVVWGNNAVSGVPAGATSTNDKITFKSMANTDNKQFASNEAPTPTLPQVGDAANTTSSSTLSITSNGLKGHSDHLNSPGVDFFKTGDYSLTNQMAIKLDGGDGAQITGTTTTNPNPTPAPGSLMLVASALPFLGMCGRMLRRRRSEPVVA